MELSAFCKRQSYINATSCLQAGTLTYSTSKTHQRTMTNILSYLSLIATLISLGAARFAYLVIWRLYYSPLSKFPGSKLAAATGWYEFYYDFCRSGRYIFEIERMHAVYGQLCWIVIEIRFGVGQLTNPSYRSDRSSQPRGVVNPRLLVLQRGVRFGKQTPVRTL